MSVLVIYIILKIGHYVTCDKNLAYFSGSPYTVACIILLQVS